MFSLLFLQFLSKSFGKNTRFGRSSFRPNVNRLLFLYNNIVKYKRQIWNYYYRTIIAKDYETLLQYPVEEEIFAKIDFDDGGWKPGGGESYSARQAKGHLYNPKHAHDVRRIERSEAQIFCIG